MDASRLSDRIKWGLNVAARATGVMASAYRPQGPAQPLAAHNRFLRLYASFCNTNGKFDRASGYGNALWHGIFDAAYTRPGDYLVQQEGTWFIAAQPRLLPVLCVRTDQTISFTRPAAPSSAGAAGYGGVTANSVVPLMSNWPASVLSMSREARSMANLPSDITVSYWTVLLPVCPSIILRAGDLMADDLGRKGVIATTELTDLGWRLAVRQATT